MIEIYAMCASCGAFIKISFRLVSLSPIEERIHCCETPYWTGGISLLKEDTLNAYSGRRVAKGREYYAEEVFPELSKKHSE